MLTALIFSKISLQWVNRQWEPDVCRATKAQYHHYNREPEK
jgi:hypothetical protein